MKNIYTFLSALFCGQTGTTHLRLGYGTITGRYHSASSAQSRLKTLALSLLFCVFTANVWAVPAYRGWQQRTLTDGSEITVRLVGDEFYHFWETQDGKIAIEQEDGTLVLSDKEAPSSEQVVKLRKAAASRKGAAIQKSYGALQPTKLLVILVNFSDKSMKDAHNNTFFQNLLNGSFPSVQDYFNQSSGGNYVPVFDVFGPYTLPNNMAYYGGNDSNGDDEHPDQMVVDACALAYADGCNFSNYDTNNDGKVDNIYVIYAGYGEAAGAPANTIWPHSWEIYSSNVTGTLTYNGKTLGHYACSAELSGKSGSNSDGVGTFAHEFSHVIGLPDYYDTDYGTNYNNGVTPGEWTLMDQGSYNGSGMYPPLYSIYDKYFMKWTTPKILKKDEIKNVTLTTTWDDGYQITGGSSVVACTNTSTVYYIENRQKSGYDQYLPGHGMVAWKVMYNSTRWSKNDLNNTAGTLRYTIVPADGKTKNYSQGSDPFPGTSNKKTWTPFTGCALTEITESSGNVSFAYNGGVVKTTWDYVLAGENCTYPDDGEVDKGAALNLTITPSSGYSLADPACWDVQMGGNKLTYGTGFTYNAGTNKFTISSVTGDVEIMIFGGHPITWTAQSSTHASNVAAEGKITLPEAPANCSATRQFVGWTTNSTYKSADTPPTYAKTGDAYSVANYYAVYADVSGGGSADATYTFTSKSWNSDEGNWTSGKDGVGFVNNGVQVTSKGTGANATCPTSYSQISSIVISYCTNASSGAGSIKMEVDGTEVIENVSSSGGTTPRDLEFDFSESTPTGAPKITVNCSTNSIYICGVTITYGSASFSGFSTDCTAPDPCALTGITLNTTGVTKAFTTGDEFNADGLVVTANYSNCSDKVVTPTSVSSPDMSSTGDKTVTVSYTEGGTTKTNTYTITVSAPTTYKIRFYDGVTLLKEESLIMSATATPPTDPEGCEEYTFVGWWTATLATTNTTAQTWITDFTVSGAQDYYAVYSHIVSSNNAPARTSAAVGTIMWSEDWTGVDNNKTPTSPSASGSSVYGGATITYAWKNGGSTSQTYTSGGPNSNENILVSKTNGSFTASGIPTGGATELTVTFATSGGGTITVSSSTENVSVSGSTITILDAGVTNFSLEFKNTNSSSNVRLDDIVVTVSTAGSGSGGGSSTTYYTTTKDCTPPTEVTVKFEANGGEGTMTDQTIDYNTATALNTNTFERTGYTFLGWATSASGEKVYDDEEEVTLTRKTTTLYAVWEINEYKVYFTTPEGATSVTVNEETTSPLTVNYGATITVVITPDAEHTISSVTAGSAAVSGEGNTRTFSMPDADVALSIIMVAKPIYTIRFINNGEIVSTQNVMSGNAAVKPSNPEACDGYEFVGWWNATLAEDNTTAQTWITSFTATGDQDYYAVYSHTETTGGGSSTPVTKTMDTFTAISGNVDSDTNISYEAAKGNAATAPAVNGGEVRIYQNGGTLTITANNSKKITAITIGSSMVTTVTYIIDDGSESSNQNISAGGTLPLSDLNASSIIFTCTGTDKNHRLYLNYLSVTYSGGGSGSSTTYYTTAPTCEVCDNKVTLTKGTPENGSFTLDKADGEYKNCKDGGLVITVSGITPTNAANYRFKEITQTGIASGVTINQDAKTVTYAKDVKGSSTINVVFEEIPSHTVTWSANGDNSNTDTFKEGAAIIFPETATGCEGKVFRGWSAVEVAETDVEPDYTTSATMGTSDVTYYAVFAAAGGAGGGAFDNSTAGNYKIYALVDDTKYYATGTGSKISSTTNAADATEYTFEKVTGGWAIKTGSTYITYSGSTNLGTSSSAYTWTISAGVNGTWRIASGTSGRAWIFRAGTGFGGYATSNVTLTSTEYYDVEIGDGGSTTYSGYTTSCVIPTEVTVTFDANGGDGTMDSQTIPYNEATALDANEFTREGYTFQGWATAAGGAKVYDDEASVTLKKNTTLYAVWGKNSYTITLADLAHGTIVTSPANMAEFEETVTITVTPTTGYQFGSITVTNTTASATVSTTGTGNVQTFTMPAGNVTISATVTEIPTYLVTWSADGDESNQVPYAEGASIVFPATASGCDGKVFVGWSSEEVALTDVAPTTFVTSATMGTSPLTYYAVFADEEGGGGEETWSETAITALTTSDVFVIVGNDLYALPNNATGTPLVSTVTISDGKITSTVGDELKWNITGNSTSGYTFYPNGNTEKWLGSNTTATTSNNTNIRIGTESRKVWEYDSNDQLSTKDSNAKRYLAVQGGSDWRGYLSESTSTTTIKFYKQTGGGASYSGYTTSCGAGINAKNIGWITATKGHKVKRVINVSAKGFDEATTLTATSSNTHFTVSLAATAVPAGKSGLSTTLTVEYTPVEYNVKEADETITLTAGGLTKTLSVSGRSLPDEFLLVTKKSSTWYALPANMTAGADEYEGVIVIPDNVDTPTKIPVSPSTLIYSLASEASSRYADNGNCVRLVGNNNLCLWSNLATTTGKTNIQNKTNVSTAATDNHDWLLTTTDGIQYTIANPHHAHYPNRRLAFGTKFGLYEEETVFYIVEAGCSSQPGEVVVSPRRADATFSWESNASSVQIDVYTDENLTALAKSETVTSQPHVMYGLEEMTDYWFKLTPVGDDDCAVIGSFKTTGPTIDIAQWTDTSVIVQIDHGDIVPHIIIDGQEEHGSITGGGGTATELFFAKYFEGAGDMKLLSIFNGTNNPIPLADYSIGVIVCGNSTNTFGEIKKYDISTLGTIRAGQEIIFFSEPLSGQTPYSCSMAFLDSVQDIYSEDANPRWILCDGSKHNNIQFNKFDFSGNDPILLLKKNNSATDTIDVIGARYTPPATKDCRNTDRGWRGQCLNMDFKKSPSDKEFKQLFKESSKSPVSTADSISVLAGFGINLSDSILGTNDDNIIATARCILFRNKSVQNGANAVLNNTATFASFTADEWNGRTVCMSESDKEAAGVSDDGYGTCNSYQDLANMDYNEYYIDYTSHVIPDQVLDPNWYNDETGLYNIPIPEMEKYTCLNLRFQLKQGETVVTEAAQQVPIIIKGEVETNNKLFSELVIDQTTHEASYSHSVERCKTCDVVVLGEATLRKGADTDPKDVPEVGNIKVYPGGKLIVPTGTEYTVNSLAFRRQEDSLSTANIEGTLNIKETGKNVYLDLRIDPTNWHYIALPFDCNVSDIRYANGDPRVPVLGTDFLIAWYDGAYRAAHKTGGWTNVEQGAVLKKGLGYIVSLPGTGKVQRELRFPMSNEVITDEHSNKIVTGVYGYGAKNDELKPNHKGWNLLGNPYLYDYSTSMADESLITGWLAGHLEEDHSMDPWDGSWKVTGNLKYIVEPIDNGWSGYKQVELNVHAMEPFTSYFVQIGAEGVEETDEQSVAFTYSNTGRSLMSQRYREVNAEDNHPVWCGVVLTDAKGEKDKTTLLVSNKFTDGYDMMDDLVKMRGDYYQYYQKPVLASRNSEDELAFNALPDNSAKAGVPLNFYASAAGQYTIALDGNYSLEEIKDVQLFDSELNVWHNLMMEDYGFTVAKKGNNTTRFTLYVTVERKQPQTPTGTDNVHGAYNLTVLDRTLVLGGLNSDASIYVYDMNGKLVAGEQYKHGSENGIWRTTVDASGVYFVRVNTATGLQTLRTIVY